MPSTAVAKKTLAIIKRGEYPAPSGRAVSLRAAINAAVKGTLLYRPDDFAAPFTAPAGEGPPRIEVTAEDTTSAARRLCLEGLPRVAALNFASARNVGGGFLGGAKAQEEDLCRCSALYACLLTQPDYYAANRACRSLLYTDHLICSPDVPFFRDDKLTLLEEPFLVSIITAPAPNAGARHREEDGDQQLRQALERRAGYVLRVAALQGHRALVLGAWGCGVFRNDPHEVADVFARALTSPPFQGAFDRVVFAIYDRTRAGSALRAFEERFADAAR